MPWLRMSAVCSGGVFTLARWKPRVSCTNFVANILRARFHLEGNIYPSRSLAREVEGEVLPIVDNNVDRKVLRLQSADGGGC